MTLFEGDGLPSMASVTDDNASILSESSDLQVGLACKQWTNERMRRYLRIMAGFTSLDF